MTPVAINYHIHKPCNLRCQFCCATFREVSGQLSLDDERRLIGVLREAGPEKLNFAGGEPTLHRHIGELVRHAKALGFVTSIVTNGARLERLLEEAGGALDWVALSVDSANEGTQRRLGRGKGTHVGQALRLAERCRALGVGLEINTVVQPLAHVSTWRVQTGDVRATQRQVVGSRVASSKPERTGARNVRAASKASSSVGQRSSSSRARAA